MRQEEDVIRPILLVPVTVMWMVLVPAMAQEAQWSVPAPGFVPPAPGEHPRLFFRKTDLPVLRKKARTTEGQAIVARLRATLGEEGKKLTAVVNDRPPANTVAGGDEVLRKQPLGMFTFSHAAGFGYLYLLTEDKLYAELSRQSLDKLFAGTTDRDQRYSWTTPGTGFRIAIVQITAAMAYDFCYDAWPEDYRQKVAKTIADNAPKDLQHKTPRSLEDIAGGGGYPPGSNHYGAYIGGAVSALALRGDPGVDTARLDQIIATAEKSLVTELTKGFGDHGWFSEGTHPGRIAANTGIVPLLQALKVAGGKDYLSGAPNGRWLTLRYVSEIVGRDGKAFVPARGVYGTDDMYDRSPMLSHNGEFAQGFGAVPAKYVPALLWTYNHFVEPVAQRKQTRFDTWVYPHHAVFALINWPVGQQATNPAEMLPRAFEDKIAGYYLFRNRWQDGDDVVITALNGTGPRGYHKIGGRPLILFAFSQKMTFGELSGATTHRQFFADGSGAVTAGGTALAVDFSGAAGVDAVILVTGPGARGGKAGKHAKIVSLSAGNQKVDVLLLSAKDQFPQPAVEGAKITIGQQTYTLAEGNWTFANLSGPSKLD